jgi:hypothetical protein
MKEAVFGFAFAFMVVASAYVTQQRVRAALICDHVSHREYLGCRGWVFDALMLGESVEEMKRRAMTPEPAADPAGEEQFDL